MTDPIEIDVWTWTLTPPDDVVARLAAHLSPDEEARARRFLSPLHGAQYRTGRGRLREILSSYGNQPPGSLHFTTNPAGKPALECAIPLAFNLSHTETFAALAVTHSPVAALGIDVERIRPIERDIARRFFSATEVAALEALAPEARTEGFYRCWTRKEAFVKAQGDGLGYPLDAFDVSIAANAPAALLRLADRPASELARWHLVHLTERDLTGGVIGAIAIETKEPISEIRLTWHRKSDR